MIYNAYLLCWQLTALQRPLVVMHDLFNNSVLDISWFVTPSFLLYVDKSTAVVCTFSACRWFWCIACLIFNCLW